MLVPVCLPDQQTGTNTEIYSPASLYSHSARFFSRSEKRNLLLRSFYLPLNGKKCYFSFNNLSKRALMFQRLKFRNVPIGTSLFIFSGIEGFFLSLVVHSGGSLLAIGWSQFSLRKISKAGGLLGDGGFILAAGGTTPVTMP